MQCFADAPSILLKSWGGGGSMHIFYTFKPLCKHNKTKEFVIWFWFTNLHFSGIVICIFNKKMAKSLMNQFPLVLFQFPMSLPTNRLLPLSKKILQSEVWLCNITSMLLYISIEINCLVWANHSLQGVDFIASHQHIKIPLRFILKFSLPKAKLCFFMVKCY